MNHRATSRLRFQSPFSILLGLLAFATTALSQGTFPSPTLTSITPLSGRPGETIRLTLRGADLEAPSAILLHDRRLAITPVKANTVTVTLPADLEPAFYDLRFVGRFGVSNPRGFQVSTLATQLSPGTNTQADKAVRVTVGSVLQGTFKAALPQWFAFEAKKGQPIIASFESSRFDVRTELMGAVLDGDGRELARMKKGALRFEPPADGSYRLRLNDLMHRGGDDYGFCVTLAPMPPVTIPNGVGLQIATKTIKPGDTISDVFPPQGEACVFDLPCKAGEKLVIEVLSHQLGETSDPHLFIESLKPDGTLTPVAQVADAPAITPAPQLTLPNRDPSYAYEAKADSTLRISLNDNFNSTSRFELRALPAPGSAPRLIALNAMLPPAAARKGYDFGTANVCAGGILALEVMAPNRHAFSEPLELKVDDKLLPGLTCLGGFIGKGQSLGYLAFQAAADAPTGAALISNFSSATYACFPVADAAREVLLTRRTGPPAIGVSPLKTPALVLTEKPDAILEVAADGKLDIPLKLTRHAEFTDALKLKGLGLTDLAKAPEADIAAKAVAGKFTLDVKALKLTPGEYGFILQGPAKMKVRANADSLATAEKFAKDSLAKQQDAQKQLTAAKIDATPQKAEKVKAAATALEAATKAKGTADTQLKDLTAKSPPKDATFIVCSNPIRIRVKEVLAKK